MINGSYCHTLYHAVNRKFWVYLYLVILAHLTTEKENTVSVNLNLQTNVQNIKSFLILRDPCVLNALFSPRKIGFIFREVLMWNIGTKWHREALLSHYLSLSLLYALYVNLYLSLLCALYTQPLFNSAVCSVYKTSIYLCCVPSM
jgi:hypothetical protein